MTPVDVPGDRLHLRELRTTDLGDLVKVYGDDTAVRYLSFEPRTPEQCAAIIESAIKDAQTENRRVYMLAVVTRDDHLVGTARLGIDERPHSGQIGFALRPDLWGQGMGGELVQLLLRLGFDVLGLKRLWGARSPDNDASRRVMERAGMIEEGRIRRHLWTRDAWRDSVVHSILDDEWRR
ncbi:GNAT family N-acetyltransferase [Marinitenerispora sediminis]|uniref:GNAT family N-acetyltransferase n=1 Tax=Marinitenerispora sediminis TaxID=1931232 RepID=A0A368TBS2_9ACTN|nr:GNAT family N-acetyltransferase [Marinitenerispora sediminis]RCV56126.1 GNAT family N-acetyltransferase [Marinitenerispora sediminis]RCV57993.1 GNAT family N-acetyltransferase [Marinitenerispora sediminis]RCV62593.1 GNAT family N-acetyltransferase [Marinitenerispora sediminis]